MGKVQREFVIDFLTTGQGRLGMCRLPGYEVNELLADIARLAAEDVAEVVTLLQTEELHLLLGMMEPEIGFFPRMAASTFRHRHFPIRNGGVPESMDAFAALVEQIHENVAAGRTVVLHCVAGHGRTGLAAACCLVRLGAEPDAAIAAVRTCRPGTIETPAQAAFVGEYAAMLTARARPCP